MNNKLLTWVLILGIASTGFAALSSADDSGEKTLKWNSEIRELMQKAKSGETLTVVEQTTLDEAKAARGDKMWKRGNKSEGKMGKHLTDDEKTALESMSDDAKKTFFDAKKAEKTAQKQANKSVIDSLIAGETLSADQETTKATMIAKIAERSATGNDMKLKRGGSEVISKLLNGETLSDEDSAELATMQEKHAERAAQKEILAPIMEKKKAGQELTEAEQTTLDEAKANHKGKKKGGQRKWPRGEK